jgi:hypothetical protein
MCVGVCVLVCKLGWCAHVEVCACWCARVCAGVRRLVCWCVRVCACLRVFVYVHRKSVDGICQSHTNIDSKF